jgi:hypothetical protein
MVMQAAGKDCSGSHQQAHTLLTNFWALFSAFYLVSQPTSQQATSWNYFNELIDKIPILNR